MHGRGFNLCISFYFLSFFARIQNFNNLEATHTVHIKQADRANETCIIIQIMHYMLS